MCLFCHLSPFVYLSFLFHFYYFYFHLLLRANLLKFLYHKYLFLHHIFFKVTFNRFLFKVFFSVHILMSGEVGVTSAFKFFNKVVFFSPDLLSSLFSDDINVKGLSGKSKDAPPSFNTVLQLSSFIENFVSGLCIVSGLTTVLYKVDV
mmetsp:Transcript_28398/g.64965  ORF Transcript_28398/g.64965 Transcript_28398/m.64965 type:complete len:148 (+) Transcript_28398:750-1193(+)